MFETKLFRPSSALKSTIAFGVALFAIFGPQVATGEEVYPKEGWVDDYDPIASPDAIVGGKLTMGGPSEYPKSFNYYLAPSTFTATLFAHLYEPLMSTNPVSLEFEPVLASKIVVSDDKLVYTVTIDERARWSDGEKLTAHDVKWTFDTILDPANLTGPFKVGLERFSSAKVVDDATIVFLAKEAHWKNFLSLIGFAILPKHAFEGKDFNKQNTDFSIVSGLYRQSEVKEGVYARMERRDDWWLKDAKRVQGTGNFQTIEHRFYGERDAALDAFKKGETDAYPVYTSHFWVNQTSGEAFDKNWIVKQAVHNSEPVGFQGFAMNMRRDQFKDLKTREALAYMLNRAMMNETMMFNQYFLHRSYVEDLWDAEHPNENQFYEFNVEKARELLREAGWVANPETGILERDGKPFAFKFLTHQVSSEKYAIAYKEDLADVGIDMSIERKDGASWSKDMDEFNFDMTWGGFSGTIWRDPTSLWQSSEANRPSSYNITGFKSEKVDALLDSMAEEYNVSKRNDIVREIDTIVTAEVPYALLWNINYTRLLYWNKFGVPDTVLSKYGNEDSLESYWWIDPDAEADLEAAKASGETLPPSPYEIHFDDEFID